MHSYEKYHYLIKNNYKEFKKKLLKFKNEKDSNKKFLIAQDLTEFLIFKNTGLYSCAELENFYLNLAESLKVTLPEKYTKNSTLHVMTEALPDGGHTRVVEKWIESAPDNEIHSVYIIDPKKDYLAQRLETAVKNKNGKIYSVEKNKTIFEKAKDLRKIASQYQYIILHIHMNDAVPLLAFGTNEFKRPVILYNHADHIFWLGVSIADASAELSSKGSYLSTNIRQIRNSYVLGVPVDEKHKIEKDKETSRKKLNLDNNKKIIMTCGSPMKYTSVDSQSLLNILLKIIITRKDIAVVAIGPKELKWKISSKILGKRFILLKHVDYEKDYFDYIAASDVLVDSYPMAGGTVMIDAVTASRPVISLESPIAQFDYLVKSQAYCNTKKEFCEKILKILDDKNYSNEIINELNQNLDENIPENFQKNLNKIKNSLIDSHTVQRFKDTEINKEMLNQSVLLNFLYRKNYKKFLKRKLIKNIKTVFSYIIPFKY